jgi:pimeloyl-ACP methyl ester carboxylesterase
LTDHLQNRIRRAFSQQGKWLRLLLGLPVMLVAVLALTSLYQAEASRRDVQAFPAPGKLIDVGGYRLHIYCTGQRPNGSPTVVFEGGLGAASVMWSMVQQGTAVQMRACSYDRAGYGWSEVGPQPRTAHQIVNELHKLLEKAGEQAPYILVGHSFGGAIIRLYASTYPDQVAGLVLVDARHEDFFQRMPPTFLQVDETNLQRARALRLVTPLGLTRLAGNAGLLELSARYLAPLPDKDEAAARAIMIYNPQHWQTSVAEREVITASYNEVRAARLRPDLTLVVLIAANGVEAWQTSSGAVDQAARDTWMGLQRELAGLTTRSRSIVVDTGGHYIQLDRPDAVIDAILQDLPQP